MKHYRLYAFLLLFVYIVSCFSLSAFAETEAPETTAGTSAAETEAPLSDGAPDRVLAPNSELLPEPVISPLPTDYEAKAKAAILLEMNSNTIVYQLNPDERLYPASLTKIMTCMLALDYGNLDDTLTVSATALENLHADGSSADLVEGEEISLRSLLYCIMLSSANEACNVVAEYISGEIYAFVDLMNEKAAALGCKDTHFANPHGLHDDFHYTTASDLLLITRKAYENQTFREISSTTTYTVPATNKSKERHLVTTNYLVSSDTLSEYYYPNATGIKTGFTTPAGRCLISTASDGNLKFMSVVLGAETEVLKDGSVWYHHFSETSNLFKFGFSSYEFALVLTEKNVTTQEEVRNAAGRGNVVLKPSEDVSALLPKNYDKSLVTTEYCLYSADGLEAPLNAGDIVGEVHVSYDGQLIGKTTLETLTEVKSNIPTATHANYDPENIDIEKAFSHEGEGEMHMPGGEDLTISKNDGSSPEEEIKKDRPAVIWIIVFSVLAAVTVVLVIRTNRRKKRRDAMRRRVPGGKKAEESEQ